MRLLVPAAAAAALLALSGCSEPEPGSPLPSSAPTETTTSASPVPSATTPPTDDAIAPDPGPAPTLPPEATTDDAAGAEAFVRYWYDALNYSIRTGDTAPVREASLLPECVECEALASSVESSYEGGGSLRGGQVDVLEAVAPAPDPTGTVLLSVLVDQEPVVEVDASGEVTGESNEEASGRSSQSVVLTWEGGSGSWLLVGLSE